VEPSGHAPGVAELAAGSAGRASSDNLAHTQHAQTTVCCRRWFCRSVGVVATPVECDYTLHLTLRERAEARRRRAQELSAVGATDKPRFLSVLSHNCLLFSPSPFPSSTPLVTGFPCGSVVPFCSHPIPQPSSGTHSALLSSEIVFILSPLPIALFSLSPKHHVTPCQSPG
jgi:hypothetical protein